VSTSILSFQATTKQLLGKPKCLSSTLKLASTPEAQFKNLF